MPFDPSTPHSESLNQSNFDPLAFDSVPGLNGTLPGQRSRADAGEAVEDTETGQAPRRGTGRRARFEDTADVPRVKDQTGEKLMESFALFLEKCAAPCLRAELGNTVC
jgi:DNA replication licensing factor MCM6